MDGRHGASGKDPLSDATNFQTFVVDAGGTEGTPGKIYDGFSWGFTNKDGTVSMNTPALVSGTSDLQGAVTGWNAQAKLDNDVSKRPKVYDPIDKRNKPDDRYKGATNQQSLNLDFK